MSTPWSALHWRAELLEARLTLQHAAQLVAAAGQSLLPRAADDSQQSLSVDATRGLLLGATLPRSGLRAALDPAGLRLLCCEGDTAVETFPLAGSTRAEALEWLRAALTARALAAGKLALPQHLPDFPDHAVAHGAAFADAPAGRAAVAALFIDTQRVLEALPDAGAGAIRLWPHHFDLARSLQRGPVSLGLGVSPGDGATGAPYWYATPWPHPPLDRLPPLGGGASWHVEGWVGGALPIARLEGDAQAQRAQVEALYRSAIAAADAQPAP